uniref:Uncharacterized protein n=1 Tax=Anguilla anguilla TaxID=7936 RepID=A0A0E9WX79_ANGAN
MGQQNRERLKKEQQNRACVEIGTSCQTLKLSTPFTSLNTAQFHLRPHTHPMLASDAEYHCSNNNVHIDFILYITVNEHDTSVMAHQRPFVLNYNCLQQRTAVTDARNGMYVKPGKGVREEHLLSSTSSVLSNRLKIVMNEVSQPPFSASVVKLQSTPSRSMKMSRCWLAKEEEEEGGVGGAHLGAVTLRGDGASVALRAQRGGGSHCVKGCVGEDSGVAPLGGCSWPLPPHPGKWVG